MIDEKFIRKRITKLRMQKDVSEYKMSLDMGHSGSYINSIASGKAMPSMGEFLYMCEYFGITPAEFFDEKIDAPIRIAGINEILRELDESDLDLILTTAKRLAKK